MRFVVNMLLGMGLLFGAQMMTRDTVFVGMVLVILCGVTRDRMLFNDGFKAAMDSLVTIEKE